MMSHNMNKFDISSLALNYSCCSSTKSCSFNQSQAGTKKITLIISEELSCKIKVMEFKDRIEIVAHPSIIKIEKKCFNILFQKKLGTLCSENDLSDVYQNRLEAYHEIKSMLYQENVEQEKKFLLLYSLLYGRACLSKELFFKIFTKEDTDELFMFIASRLSLTKEVMEHNTNLRNVLESILTQEQKKVLSPDSAKELEDIENLLNYEKTIICGERSELYQLK